MPVIRTTETPTRVTNVASHKALPAKSGPLHSVPFRPYAAPALRPITVCRIALATIAERRAMECTWYGSAEVASAHLASAERHTRAALRMVEALIMPGAYDAVCLSADLIYRAADLGKRSDLLSK